MPPPKVGDIFRLVIFYLKCTIITIKNIEQSFDSSVISAMVGDTGFEPAASTL